MPKITIVLPTYNGERYIRESIDSIMNQTLSDWELVIVDDCSIDCTPEIVDEYAKSDSRIKIIHNKRNRKLPCSLNIGFDNSVGNFLTWTSDDNYYLPEALENMYKYLSINEDVYMVCTDMEAVDANGKLVGKWPSYDERDMYLHNCVGACFMYRRDVYREVGSYNADKIYVEDYEYWLRVLRKYGKIGHIPQILYGYRIHGDRLTERKKAEIRKQLAALRKEQLGWILEKVKDDRAFACRLYYEFLNGMDKKEAEDIRDGFFEKYPVLSKDKKPWDNRKYIVYGAGNVGEQAASRFRDSIRCFADNDESKVHGKKCGFEIISFGEMLKLQAEYNIMIAVGNEKIYEMIRSLFENGVGRFCTYQTLVFEDESKWRMV